MQIQDASNLCGLGQRFSGVVKDLRSCLPAASTAEINQHPVCRLWTSKMHDLAGMGLSDAARFHDAYTACEALASMQVSGT